MTNHSHPSPARLAATLLLTFLALAACMPTPKPPATMPDLSTTRMSEQGLFRASFKAALDPIQMNQMHNWTLHVDTADGQPVTGAVIRVDGGMPDHGHGLPTDPKVTAELGNGDYQVEGLKFSMGGWWVVNFHIEAGGRTDVVTFNLWFS